jgi:hypothetical protein
VGKITRVRPDFYSAAKGCVNAVGVGPERTLAESNKLGTGQQQHQEPHQNVTCSEGASGPARTSIPWPEGVAPPVLPTLSRKFDVIINMDALEGGDMLRTAGARLVSLW